MPRFKIEQFVTYSQEFVVSAPTLGEAVKQVVGGQVMSSGMKFYDANEEIGMPTNELEESDFEILKEHIGREDFVPSIRSAVELKGGDEDDDEDEDEDDDEEDFDEEDDDEVYEDEDEDDDEEDLDEMDTWDCIDNSQR